MPPVQRGSLGGLSTNKTAVPAPAATMPPPSSQENVGHSGRHSAAFSAASSDRAPGGAAQLSRLPVQTAKIKATANKLFTRSVVCRNGTDPNPEGLALDSRDALPR